MANLTKPGNSNSLESNLIVFAFVHTFILLFVFSLVPLLVSSSVCSFSFNSGARACCFVRHLVYSLTGVVCKFVLTRLCACLFSHLVTQSLDRSVKWSLSYSVVNLFVFPIACPLCRSNTRTESRSVQLFVRFTVAYSHSLHLFICLFVILGTTKTQRQ